MIGCKWEYKTPEGFDDMVMVSDGKVLTGLYFQKSGDENKFCGEYEEKFVECFEKVINWLDVYFSGNQPNFELKYKIENMTSFRKKVFEIMKTIPYGQTISYGDIASEIAKQSGVKRMSAQAVGGAVGWNPICIVIPCHRVVGAHGEMTGYGGGLKNKIKLLQLEKVNL